MNLDKNEISRVIKIRGSLEEGIRENLIDFLKKIKDVFAKSHEDMPGISLDQIMHSLMSAQIIYWLNKRGKHSTRNATK